MEQKTCNKCGRPIQYATEPKCNYCDACMSEYCGCKLGRIKEIEPTCDSTAVIPSITVDSVEGITNLANCLVHVNDINTTFYVDDKHRVMITWAGPVNIPGYDMEANPNHYKNQIVTDTEAETAVIYDNHGKGYTFGITQGSLQDAIDQKLNEMATDGTLEEIINQEIFSDINAKLNRLTNDKVLLIGDSYLQGYNGQQSVNSWGYYFKQASGMDDTNCYTLYESGAGFTKQGNAGHTFLTLLQANIASITDKENYTDVIIGFGLNEASNTQATITTAIGTFMTYAKAQFPNAKFYLGMVGNIKQVGSDKDTGRERLYNRVLMAARNASQFGVKYLTGVEQVAHDWSLFGTDSIHLTQDGYQYLGWAMYQAWKNGAYNYYSIFSATQTITSGGDLANPTNNLTAQVRISGQNRQIVLGTPTIGFTAFEVANAKIKLTDDNEMANNGLFRNIAVANPSFPVDILFTKSDNSTIQYPCELICDTSNGSVRLNVPSNLNGVTIKSIKFLPHGIYNIPTLLS